MIVTRHLILGTCASAFYYNTIGLLYILWILEDFSVAVSSTTQVFSLRDHLNPAPLASPLISALTVTDATVRALGSLPILSKLNRDRSVLSWEPRCPSIEAGSLSRPVGCETSRSVIPPRRRKSSFRISPDSRLSRKGLR